MVLYPTEAEAGGVADRERSATLWVVASREHSPGPVANYLLDYPFWGFRERPVSPADEMLR